MSVIQNKLVVFFILALAIPHFGITQDSLNFDLRYEVNRVFKPLSISRETLNDANTLVDLNKNYETDWVMEYKSVEISTRNNGKTKKAMSKDNVLTQEQKVNMRTADIGSDISICVKYYPKNTLPGKGIKENKFSFSVYPDFEAEFKGGKPKLKHYLKQNVVNKIPGNCFSKYQLTAVKFTVDEKGDVTQAHVVESSNDEKVDDLLLDAILNMPKWKPAEYANGTKVSQDFVLTAGDMSSCVINALNIRHPMSVNNGDQ